MFYRRLREFLFRSVPPSVMAESFFPLEYKAFPFNEGDLLASQHRDGTFSIAKVLRIDRITLKAGESLNIQGSEFIAPIDDFLLVIGIAYGEADFESLEEARAAAKAGTWHVTIGHVPIRPPGAAQNRTLIGHQPVRESELVGYKQWKSAFQRGEAGVF